MYRLLAMAALSLICELPTSATTSLPAPDITPQSQKT